MRCDPEPIRLIAHTLFFKSDTEFISCPAELNVSTIHTTNQENLKLAQGVFEGLDGCSSNLDNLNQSAQPSKVDFAHKPTLSCFSLRLQYPSLFLQSKEPQRQCLRHSGPAKMNCHSGQLTPYKNHTFVIAPVPVPQCRIDK